MHFDMDPLGFWIALALLIPYCLYLFLIRKRPDPFIYFSNLNDLKAANSSWKIRFQNLPKFFYYAALCCWILAFIDPRIDFDKSLEKKKISGKSHKLATEGIAIYFLLDQSGSMASQVVANPTPDAVTLPSKMDLLKTVTKEFIIGDPELGVQGRDNDLIGLVTFARTAHVLTPLTLDHDTLIQELARLHVVKDESQDGTAIGYAIYKTANIIAASRHFSQKLIKEGKPFYDLKGAVMILVTDGFQAPHPDDKGNRLRTMGIEEAAQFAKEQGIKLYIINIDPTIDDEEYAPQRRLMIRAAENTGGKFYPVSDPNRLRSIYSEIDRLEKSSIPESVTLESLKMPPSRMSTQFRYMSFYLYLIGLGLASLLLGVLSETMIFRRVP